MHHERRLNSIVLSNAIWFAGSLVLAFFVWVIATYQSDPIQQRRFPERLPVQLVPDEGLLVTAPQAANRTVSVVIRAPRSVLDLLTREEIEVWGELDGLPPGEHSVELQARLARSPATVLDISPRLMRVTLEELLLKQVPLRSVVTAEPPAGFTRDQPEFDISLNQAQARGPSSKVTKVVAAQVWLDLSQQRNPLETDLRLTPVDADGVAVDEVGLDPEVVRVRVNIRRRDDVREVSVRPQLVGSLPEGYVLNTLSYMPQVLLVSGAPSELNKLPDLLTTAPINLTDRTSSFEVSVPVVLPEATLVLLSEQNIRVSVEISPLTASRQFNDIPVEVIGRSSQMEARLSPNRVTVLITGPQPVVESLNAADIRVAIDLNGLSPGNHTAVPTVTINRGQIPSESISVLPAEIDVEITAAGVSP